MITPALENLSETYPAISAPALKPFPRPFKLHAHSCTHLLPETFSISRNLMEISYTYKTSLQKQNTEYQFHFGDLWVRQRRRIELELSRNDVQNSMGAVKVDADSEVIPHSESHQNHL
jgi:hypothetical protein